MAQIQNDRNSFLMVVRDITWHLIQKTIAHLHGHCICFKHKNQSYTSFMASKAT